MNVYHRQPQQYSLLTSFIAKMHAPKTPPITFYAQQIHPTYHQYMHCSLCQVLHQTILLLQYSSLLKKPNLIAIYISSTHLYKNAHQKRKKWETQNHINKRQASWYITNITIHNKQIDIAILQTSPLHTTIKLIYYKHQHYTQEADVDVQAQ